MAEIEETEMPATSIKPEKEWSTREKLAIASYVLRSGEQNWSGAGRFLRPLGEPGRPGDWFSPKFCAQQYTALMEQLAAPKRKRSERSESSENIQPTSSPEEVIIARLTKERIEELKKQERCERTEQRKLRRDIDLIESGALDDQLDDLIKEIECGGKTDGSRMDVDEKVKDDEDKAESVITNVEMSDSEQAASKPVAQVVENEQPIEEISRKSVEEQPLLAEEENNTNKSNEAIDRRETTAASNEGQDAEVDDSKTDSSLAVEHAPETVGMLKEEQEQIETVSQPVANATAMEEDSFQQRELPSGDITEPQVEVKREAVEVQDQPQNKEEATAVSDLEERESKPEKTEKSEVLSAQEADVSSSISADDEAKQSISLPGTPAPSGSFLFDSFPSSPALSHNSDMDPDATASWKAWKKSIMILWKQIASHRLANIFLTPVTDEIAPNYSTTVYKKMDLIMIKKNIESGVIRTTSEFQRDIMLMFQNAVMYNNVEHDVYKMATEMQKDVIDQIAQYLTTQMIVESSALPPENKSLRRSTIRRSALIDKGGQTRSRRSAAADGDLKSAR